MIIPDVRQSLCACADFSGKKKHTEILFIEIVKYRMKSTFIRVSGV